MACAARSSLRPSLRPAYCLSLVLCLSLTITSFVGAQTGSGITYIYDELGRLVAVVDPEGETAIYTYDAVGNLLSISRQSSLLVSIIEFTPNGGSVDAAVTIYGTGFSATASQNTVTFNGVAATVTSATSTRIVTSVPSGATTGPISITTPTGSATSSTSFAVSVSMKPTITSFTPTIGTAGTAVTVSGTNFETSVANNRVKFNATLASVSSATAVALNTSVTATTASGRITVSTQAGTAISSGDFFIPPSPYTATDVAVTDRMTIGGSRTITLNTANKIALVLFDGVEGQRVSLNANSSSIAGGVVTIYNPNGTTLSYTTVNTSGGFLDSSLLTATGTYTVLIDPSGTNTGSLNFTLYNVSDIASTIAIGGSSLPISFTTLGQNARITFSGTAGQRVSLGMSNVTVGAPNCCDTASVSISKPDGTTLLAPYGFGPSGGGTPSQILPVTGTYTIFVNPYTTKTGNVTLTLSEDLAPPISIGGPSVTLNMSRPGQNAWLTFNGTAGQRVSLGMSGVTIGAPNCCDTAAVSIYNPSGTTLLAPFAFGPSGNGTPTQVLPVTGTYAIFVDPYAAKTGNVTLTLSAEISGSISVNGPSVTVSPAPGQNVRLTFDGTAGQWVSLGMSGVTIGAPNCCYTASVSIYKPDGTTLLAPFGFGPDGGGTPSLSLPVTGAYVVFVDPYGAKTGNVTLTLSSDVTGSISVNGPSVTATNAPGQNIRLSFDGNAGQRISVGMSGVTIGAPNSNHTASVSVYKPDGTTLLSPYGFGTSGAGTPSLVLPATGTYTIFVDPYGAKSGNVTLTLSEDLAASISIGGPSVTLEVNRPGQNGRLTFDGAAGQRLSLGMTGVTIGAPYCCDVASVSILRPDGTTLLAPYAFGTRGGGTTSVLLPTTGTYSIILDPSTDKTGSITLTLSEDVTGTVTIGGPSAAVAINRPGQNARLTFDGASGQQVTIRVTGNTISDVTVKLLKPDGTQLTSSVSSSSSFNLATQTLPTTGTYTISIDPAIVNTGSMSVSVTSP